MVQHRIIFELKIKKFNAIAVGKHKSGELTLGLSNKMNAFNSLIALYRYFYSFKILV